MNAALRLDLHVHSRHSPDSRLAVEEIAQRLAYTGLRGFALTDHNSVAGHAELAELARTNRSYLFLPGVEISTVEGHLLAYGVAELPPVHRPVAETVEWVRNHGGETVLAHPFRLRHGAGRRLAESLPVSGLEARNAHNSELSNLRAELLAATRGIAATGGSDVHTFKDLGRAYTSFPDDASTVDDLLEASRRRRTAPGGRSLSRPAQLRQLAGSGARFVARGFRSI